MLQFTVSRKAKKCEAGRDLLRSQLSILDDFERPNPFEDITESDPEDAANKTYFIEEDEDEITDVD